MTTFEGMVPTFANRAQWTLPAVLAHQAETQPDATWLEVPSTGETFTFGQVWELAQRVAGGLRADGLAVGDRVVIFAANSSDHLLAWLGAVTAGMVEVPINTAYRGAFLEHQVRTVAPAAVVVDAERVPALVASQEAFASVIRVYLVGEVPAEARQQLAEAGFEVGDFRSLYDGPAGEPVVVEPGQLASIFFTSGTTGLSKGVMMTHAHMYFFADECACLTRLTPSDVYLSTGPLFHGNSQFLAAYPTLIAGCRYVMRERFSASNWLRWVRDSGVTVTNFVGVMMDFVWQQPPTERDRDNTLRCVFAAPTATYVEQFRERFGVEAFVEVFGLTETCMPIMTPYGEPRPIGAAGKLVSEWFEIRLVDERDEEVPVGAVGELTVRPRVPFIVTAGYYGMPERTVEATRNLWFHTGDGLRLDADGWYYFVDRLKDAIRRRGENISSYEVEQALLSIEGVEACAVIGVPADNDAGEDEVMAFLVASNGTRPDPEAVWQVADERLPYFAVPRYLRFVDELPVTPSAKVQKAKLRDLGVDADTWDRGDRGSTRKHRPNSPAR